MLKFLARAFALLSLLAASSCTLRPMSDSRALDLITYETYRGNLVKLTEGDASAPYGLRLASLPDQPPIRIHLQQGLAHQDVETLASRGAYVEVHGYFAANTPGAFLAKKLVAVAEELRSLTGYLQKSDNRMFGQAPYYMLVDDPMGQPMKIALILESAALESKLKLMLAAQEPVVVSGYSDSDDPGLFIAVSFAKP